MLLTVDALYIVTTKKKGKYMTPADSKIQCANRSITTASYLEPLKGGKVPVELLIRGKDAEENTKHFEKCIEIIKTAGVCLFATEAGYGSAELL